MVELVKKDVGKGQSLKLAASCDLDLNTKMSNFYLNFK